MPDYPNYVVWFRGRPACPCLAEWLPAFEAELQRRRIITGALNIYQLIGTAAASASTHSRGGAFDLVDMPGGDDVWVARQMGADATWSRTAPAFSPPHIHGVLRGCPHNGPARYQYESRDFGVDHDRNGLANGGKDDGPRPLSGRTWREGIKWAKQQEDDMPYTEEQLRKIVREEVAAQTDEIAKATAKAVLDSEVIARLDVSVREALRAEFNNAARHGQRKS